MAIRKTTEEFIQEAVNLYGNQYDYSLVEYTGAFNKVKIICEKHGMFEQCPHNHLLGRGCRKCGVIVRGLKRRKTTEQFIHDAISVHSDMYDYSLVEYIGAHKKVKIICPNHGDFEQAPHDHLKGKGCSKCSHTTSKQENQWLKENIDLPYTNEHRQVWLLLINGKEIRVDGYIPDTKTIYEYYGDYWHGNPVTKNPNDINANNKKSFGQLYNETLARESLIKESGYNLVTMWESDWKASLT